MTWRTGAGVGVAVVALGLAFFLVRSHPEPTPQPSPAAPVAGGLATPALPAETPAPFRPLLGAWLRPDGGYVLEVRSVAPDGRASVAYFNPRPIRVARAEARQEGPHLGLFVEFDDQNYRGSTYALGYDRETDQLRGIYHQAALGQRFEVVFVRRR